MQRNRGDTGYYTSQDRGHINGQEDSLGAKKANSCKAAMKKFIFHLNTIEQYTGRRHNFVIVSTATPDKNPGIVSL